MKRLWIACAVLTVAALAALSLLTSGAPAVLAQNPNPTHIVPTLTLTPVPSPTRTPEPNETREAAAAFFTVDEATMTSRYPQGVEYLLRIRSSQGEITRAQVLTWGGEHDRIVSTQPLEWDAERGAYVYFDHFFSPPWIELNYRFRASDSAGNTYESENVTADYSDPSRDWTRLEDDNVIVLFFGAPESLGDVLFESASNAIETLEWAFGFSLDYKPYVVVVPDSASFNEWQEHPDPYVAGLTLSGLGYTIQRTDLQNGMRGLADTVVPHELTHIFQGFIEGDNIFPYWFTEGHASYFEPVHFYDYESRVRLYANDPSFPTLRSAMSYYEDDGPDGRGRWKYDVGFSFVKYWIDSYGIESHRLFWQAQVEMDFYDAMAYATGRDFDELEAEWRAYIGARGPAPTLIPTPTLAFDPFTIPTPTAFVPQG